MTNRSTPHHTIEDFPGTIGRTLADSEPLFEQEVHPGDDAPNVVLVLLDDTGFSHLSCFGSVIDTPNFDRLAAAGLRYTHFHTTALCSPTRACLLTGRNHHSVGMRAVSNFDTGFPNMRGRISPTAATLAELLDVSMLIVHVSGREAVEQIRTARGRGLRVYAETCPQYLFLTEEDLAREGFEGAKCLCSPPPRDAANQEIIW